MLGWQGVEGSVVLGKRPLMCLPPILNVSVLDVSGSGAAEA
jgi:hypothetical protein